MNFAKKSTTICQESLIWMLYSSLVLPIILLLMILVQKVICFLYLGSSLSSAFVEGFIIFVLSSVIIANFIALWIIPPILLYTVVLFFLPSLDSTPIYLVLSILLIYILSVLITYQYIFENVSSPQPVLVVLEFFLILILPKLYLRLRATK